MTSNYKATFKTCTNFTSSGDTFVDKISANPLLKFSGKERYISFSSNFQYESPDKKKQWKKKKKIYKFQAHSYRIGIPKSISKMLLCQLTRMLY